MSPHRALAAALAATLAACATSPSAAAPAIDPPGLPGFGGMFRGTLRMFGAEGERTVAMGLDVLPADGAPGEFTWRLRYGEGDAGQVRDYRLQVLDAAAGRYQIDEQNGIVLAARRFDDELVSLFAGGDQLLFVRYRAVPAGIAFALESCAPQAGTPTGQGVRSIAEFGCQRGILVRLPAAAAAR
jgi:hypothetical protein